MKVKGLEAVDGSPIIDIKASLIWNVDRVN